MSGRTQIKRVVLDVNKDIRTDSMGVKYFNAECDPFYPWQQFNLNHLKAKCCFIHRGLVTSYSWRHPGITSNNIDNQWDFVALT